MNGGGLSAVDVYGSGGRIASSHPSMLVEGTGADSSITGAHSAKWYIGLVLVLVALRWLWEKGS